MTTTGCDWQYCCNSGENASFLHSSWKEVIHGDKICLNHISLVMKNPVFGVFDKVGLKLASSATENSYTLEILDLASIGIILSEQLTTKALIRLHWCTGWSAPFFVRIWNKQIFSWRGSSVPNVISDFVVGYLSRDMTKPTKLLYAQRRLGSAWASAQSDQRLHCPHEESVGP